MTKIIVNSQIYLDFPNMADVDDYVLYLNEQEIFDNTLKLPLPYSREHAIAWIQHQLDFTTQYGIQKQWTIRSDKGESIGGIGIHIEDTESLHQVNACIEIGYWLAKPFWNKGIMTLVLKSFCEFLFNHTEIICITAHTFAFNLASQRVAEKAGFINKGKISDFFEKEDKLMDAVKLELHKIIPNAILK